MEIKVSEVTVFQPRDSIIYISSFKNCFILFIYLQVHNSVSLLTEQDAWLVEETIQGERDLMLKT